LNFVYRVAAPLPPREVFERLRHYERIYPLLHPAHQPFAPGYTPQLLSPGYRFAVAERFGPEARAYDFRVTAHDPAALRLTLESATVTTIGPVRIRSRLTVDFGLAATPTGTDVTVTQTISFGRPWLDRLLNRPALWRKVARHADEECEAAVRLLLDPDFAAA
jgi:hypothetical protein